MAQYPIKMLKDENGTPFVPLVAPEAVKDGQGFNLQTVLGNKLEKTNIIAGSNITLSVSGNDITINSQAGGATTNVIDNLNQQTAGVGVLDAHQGYVLKGMIPGVQNSLTSTSTTDALSAYQGYLLSNRSVPGGGTAGQVLKKKSNTDNDVEWGSLPTLATVATTGAYSDLSGKPTIPTVTDNVTSTSTTSALSANQGKLLNDKFDTHTHGLLNNNLTVALANTTTDSGWSMISNTYNGFLLKSIRSQASAPAWFCNNYSAGVAFGGADTKGVISLSYSGDERVAKFAGGNGTAPVWWYGIKGNSGTIYNMQNIVSMGTYSTTETNTGMTWIDGKAIYRKVIAYTGNPSGQAISTGITGMTWLVNAWGVAKIEGDQIYLPMNFYNQGGWNTFHVSDNGTTIQYQRDTTNYKTIKMYFVLEYTK